jgi:hypothetical protein
MSSSSPEHQETLRVASRDLWRTTLSTSFALPPPPPATPHGSGSFAEQSVGEARDNK